MRRRNRATIDRYANLQLVFSSLVGLEDLHNWRTDSCVCVCIGFSVAKQKHARVRLCVRLTGIINTKDSGNELDSTEQTCLNTNQYHIFLLVNLFNQCANISANEQHSLSVFINLRMFRNIPPTIIHFLAMSFLALCCSLCSAYLFCFQH